ncbi:MAG: CBS domain-containing protein [Thermodesulfobacteriota bacterium]|nr:CBS domain-containing protein [Thermodesulfobacteriota bacterium]
MLTAKDIMTSEVITVKPDLLVEKLAEILWENKISGVPVLDDNDTLVAVVTENDLIDQTKKIHIPSVITLLDSVIFLESAEKMEKQIKKITGATVGDICAEKLVSVNEETPLNEIATIMAEKRVHTLPVLSGDKLVGVVGKSDIIKTLAKK